MVELEILHLQFKPRIKKSLPHCNLISVTSLSFEFTISPLPPFNGKLILIILNPTADNRIQPRAKSLIRFMAGIRPEMFQICVYDVKLRIEDVEIIEL